MDDELSTTFKALADPTRRALLNELRKGEASVNELAEPFELSIQAISKHLKVLEHAGLVEKDRRGQLRPTTIKGDQLKNAADWLLGYSSFWEDTLDRLDDHLKKTKTQKRKSK